MSWRFKKRFIYVSLIIFFIALILSPKLYKIIFYPSCYNNRLDPNEEGIDCGGPCIPCEVKELQDLVVQKPFVLVYPDNTMDLIGIVKNPNREYGLKLFEYKFIIYGPNKEKFEKDGQSFILPLESKYIVENNLPVPNFSIVNYELEVNYQKENWLKAELEFPKITLLNYEVEGNQFKGEIMNESFIHFPNLNLVFIFKDNYGEIIGSIKTTIYNLSANERRKIYLSNLPPLLGKVSEVIIQPEVNIFEL